MAKLVAELNAGPMARPFNPISKINAKACFFDNSC
jgi:hypothetical protein